MSAGQGGYMGGSELPAPERPTEEAECPECASALFPVPAVGFSGWVWSHDPLEFSPCPSGVWP